jgi:DNA polymerase V
MEVIQHKKSGLEIETRTTGFSSPATDYAEKRLDLNDLVSPNTFSTFYFQVDEKLSSKYFRPGNIIVVDRMQDPKVDDFCLGVDEDNEFVIYQFGDDKICLWGKITWVLKNIGQ